MDPSSISLEETREEWELILAGTHRMCKFTECRQMVLSRTLEGEVGFPGYVRRRCTR